MGLLDGGIQAVFGAAFGAIYLPGTLTRVSLVGDGQGGGSSVPSTQPCRVQVDACTEAMRMQAGYSDTDVRLLVLQAGIAGGPLDTDCIITPEAGPHAGTRFAVAGLGPEDPAASYWECRGQRTE